VVSDGRNVTMAPTLGGAMAGLELPVEVGDVRAAPPTGAPTDWSSQALDLLDRAESRLRDGDWAGYGDLMGQLRRLLERGTPATDQSSG
jgi:hypothetical protein